MNVDYILYTTERCNLTCVYCENAEDRGKYQQDIDYDKNKLVKFLNKQKNVNLHFYGGEPLLNIAFIDFLLKRVNCKRATLQTNGLLFHRLSKELLNKFEVVSISLDGSEKITDEFRGKGVYKKAIDNVKKIKDKGYNGIINVRMTITPGVDIQDSVEHFIDDCKIKFDYIHWQLNVLFHENDWKSNKKGIIKWFDSYNQKITLLIKRWIKEMVENKRVLKIVPFIGIINSLINNIPINNFRCGAGWDMFVITTKGDLFPCPVLREYNEFNLGNIDKLKPTSLNYSYNHNKCKNCDVFELCGGRCLCASLKNEWDEEGYDLVCNSVKHLIKKLIKVYPIIKKLIEKKKISLNDFNISQDYEVIP